MWYYFKNDQKTGPMTEGDIRALIEAAILPATTPVWREGMTEWVPLNQTSLGSHLPLRPSISRFAPPENHPARTVTKLKYALLWLVFTISISLDLVLTFSAFYILEFFRTENGPQLSMGFFLAGMIVGLFAFVMDTILVYKSWKVIQPFDASLTPGVACGLLFIPLFNLYWRFRAFYCLATNIDRILAVRATAARANSALALTSCILGCVSFIPGVMFFTIFPWAILSIAAWRSILSALAELENPQPGSVIGGDF